MQLFARKNEKKTGFDRDFFFFESRQGFLLVLRGVSKEKLTKVTLPTKWEKTACPHLAQSFWQNLHLDRFINSNSPDMQATFGVII
jgi:hypothetical protein